MNRVKKSLNIILILAIFWALFYPNSYQNDYLAFKSEIVRTAQNDEGPAISRFIEENGIYTTKDDVALYIHTFGKLPPNFVSKEVASVSGWRGGGLEEYIPGACIGGNKFGNYQEILPESFKRIYRECDIDTLGMDSRGSKRIVYSNDGLIYYTEDHYRTFELLYGIEESPKNE